MQRESAWLGFKWVFELYFCFGSCWNLLLRKTYQIFAFFLVCFADYVDGPEIFLTCGRLIWKIKFSHGINEPFVYDFNKSETAIKVMIYEISFEIKVLWSLVYYRSEARYHTKTDHMINSGKFGLLSKWWILYGVKYVIWLSFRASVWKPKINKQMKKRIWN